MTVEAFAKEIGCKIICMPSPNKNVRGVYIGDLLSWVMAKAESENVWITIMSNINTIAVATLTDASCILLCEDVIPDENALCAAREQGVNILSTPLSAYDAVLKISELNI